MNVYIGGDSWGCGEWYYDGTNNNTHRGLEQYLIDDGHTVINKSLPGSGNLKTHEILSLTDPNTFDVCVLFQTLSLRDNERWDSMLTWRDFVVTNEEIKALFYKRLGTLPFKIHLIGGLEKVSGIERYKNLNALVESVPEWLTGNKYEAGPLRSPAGLKLYDQVSKHVNHNVLDNLENNVDYWNETVGSNKMYFQPDGRHANKFAHRKIYQVLKKEFKN